MPYEMFIAHVEAGDRKQTMINEMVAVYGLRIAKSYSPGAISAVSALEYIYDKYGHDILNRTLRLVLGTWEGDRQSLTSGMLKGIARVVYVYGETLNDERFKENVGRNSAKTISRTAKDRRAGTLGYAEALVMAYNAKSKYRLPIKTLYWNGRKRDEEPEEYEEYEEEM